MRSLLLSTSFLLLTTVAHAQMAPLLSSPDAASGSPVGQTGNLNQPLNPATVQVQRPPLQLPQQQQMGRPLVSQDPPAPDAVAAPPAQPPGGFAVTPPKVPSEDVTNRMNLNGANNYLNGMASDANGRMNQMLNGALPQSGQTGGVLPSVPPGTDLPMATPQKTSDLDQLTSLERQNAILKAEVERAKLTTDYWGMVYNNPSAREWRDQERKDKEAQDKRDNELAKIRAETDRMKAAGATDNSMPVVYSVDGGKAVVIMNGGTRFTVHVGNTLANGMKVVAISAIDGVTVDQNGQRTTLGFGVPTSAVPQTSAVGTPIPVAR